MTTPSFTFAQPARPGQFKVADHNGKLALFEVLSLEKDVQTAFGISDAIRANVVVLDGPGAPIEEDNAFLFGRALVASLTPLVGQQTLGRIGQGAAKPGQSAAWILNDYTAADAQIAIAYINTKAQGQFAQPTPAPAPQITQQPIAYDPNGQLRAQQGFLTSHTNADPVITQLLATGRYTLEQLQTMQKGGVDMAAVLAAAQTLGAQPV